MEKADCCEGCPKEGLDVGCCAAQIFELLRVGGLMAGLLVDQFEFAAVDQSTCLPTCWGNAEGFEEGWVLMPGRDG